MLSPIPINALTELTRVFAVEHFWQLMVFGLILLLWELLRSKIVLRDFWNMVVVIGGAIFLTYLFFGRVVGSNFGIIDDHEIALYLGSDHSIKLAELLPVLLTTEVGKPGSSLRYRPAYYALRLTEAFAWGDNVRLWYRFRLLILASFLAACWSIASNYWGIFFSGMAFANLLRLHFWSDLFARLGPAETYAILGCTLCLWAYQTISKSMSVKSETKTKLAWLLLYVGCAICVGVKENFIPLIIPVIYFSLLHRKSRSWGKFQLATLAGCVLWTAFIAISVIVALSKSSADVYANSVSLIDRGLVVADGLLKKHSLIIFTLTVTGYVLVLRNSALTFKKWIDAYVAFGVITWLVLISQHVFYNGNWPQGNRYDFPGVFIAALFYLVTLHFIVAWLRSKQYFKYQHTNRYLSIFVIMLTASGNYAHISNAVEENIHSTQAFAHTMETISHLARAQEDEPVIIEVGDYSQYEPAVSYARFLPFYQITNPIFLSVDRLPEFELNSKFDQHIFEHLHSISQQGSESVLPIHKLSKPMKKCISIQLATDSPSDCKTAVIANSIKILKIVQESR